MILKKSISKLILLMFSYLSWAQSADNFSLHSGGTIATSQSLNVVYTIGENFVDELDTPELQISEGFLNPQLRIQVNIAAYLQGASIQPEVEGLMNDLLRQQDLIPTTSPYHNYTTIDAEVLNQGGSTGTGVFQDDIVDWVLVELRDSNDATKLIKKKSALLQRDGDVVALDGVSTLSIEAEPRDYFVAIKHRNHIGIMSLLPVTLSETEIALDFTDSNTNTFGNNARTTFGMPNNILGLWSGATEGSEAISFSGANNSVDIIKDYVLADPANIFNVVTFQSIGYSNSDTNMDGVTRFSGAGEDGNLIKDNVLSHPSNIFGVVTYKIETAIPEEN